jgi:transposase
MRMTQRQWQTLELLKRIERGELTIARCAESLGLSPRQVKRLRKKLKRLGEAGVLHGNTGREPKHKTGPVIRDRIVSLRRTKYDGFNDQHFAEKLEKVEGISVSGETVRRILRAEGIGSPRKRRRAKHFRRRDRRPQAGAMILWDGSRHDWLEGRGPWLCLMGAIDDATGELLPGAHFVEQECTLGYLRVLRDIVREKGIPLTAYMDRHGTLKRNDSNWTLEEQLAGEQYPTQVGRALSDLGIGVIYALTPQAKGRIERLWGTLQDRLVSELRLAGARTAIEANRVLQRYRSEHNSRFAISPKNATSAWRAKPESVSIDDVCSVHRLRVVANNNTVRVDKRVIDIPVHPSRATFARCEVLVCHHVNGRYRVFYKGQRIASARGKPPTEADKEPRTYAGPQKKRGGARTRPRLREQTGLATARGDDYDDDETTNGVTESLTG